MKLTEDKSFELEFHRTGDWWIDFGLVVLHEQIEKSQDMLDELNLEFSKISITQPNIFKLKGDRDTIGQFLIDLKDDVVTNSYVTYKSGKKNFYLDPQDLHPCLYEKRSLQLYLKKFFNGIVPSPKSKIFYDSLNLDQQTNLKIFLDENDSQIDAADIKRSHEKGLFVGEPIVKIDWKPDIDAGKQFCNFSGQSFNKLTEVKGYHYPALVDPDKMQTFYSGHHARYRIGSPYALAGIMAPLGLRYAQLKNGTDSSYIFFLPKANDLNRLLYVQHQWLPSILEVTDSRQCNFDYSSIFTSYLNESLLVYLLSIYKKAHLIGLSAEYVDQEEMISNLLHLIQDSSGISIIAFTDTEFEEYRGIADLFQDFMQMENLNITSKQMINLLKNLIKYKDKRYKQKVKTRPRELLSKCMLFRRSISEICEDYVFEEDNSPNGIFNFTSVYTEVIGKMSKEQLELCDNIGFIIGSVAVNRKSIGVIYDFRNAKTQDQFLRALEHFQFILGGKKDDPGCFNEERLSNFIEIFTTTPEWKEMKSITVIKAVNHYRSAIYSKNSKSIGEN